jgi:exonuclease III
MRLVKENIYTNKKDIISLQETKKTKFKDRTLRNFSKKISKWLVLPSIGAS